MRILDDVKLAAGPRAGRAESCEGARRTKQAARRRGDDERARKQAGAACARQHDGRACEWTGGRSTEQRPCCGVGNAVREGADPTRERVRKWWRAREAEHGRRARSLTRRGVMSMGTSVGEGQISDRPSKLRRSVRVGLESRRTIDRSPRIRAVRGTRDSHRGSTARLSD